MFISTNLTIINSGNYRNIGNNFVSGGVFAQQQQQQSPMAQRQTRSNAAAPVAAQPVPIVPTVTPVASSTNNIQIKVNK